MWTEGCAGGVCHSPAEGSHWRGCAGRVPLLGATTCPGGLQGGQKGVRWRGVPGGGVYIGCRPFLCKVLLLGAAACCCLNVGAD